MDDQYFYGHGKLLLTGEYFVLDGAMALALPTTVGQSMKVRYRHSYQPTLNWKSFSNIYGFGDVSIIAWSESASASRIIPRPSTSPDLKVETQREKLDFA